MRAPAGVWVGWICQPVPFHPSASVCVGRPFCDDDQSPTLAQNVALAHETANRSKRPNPAGCGTCSGVHVVPSHDSARPRMRPETSVQVPTDVQVVAPEQETPVSELEKL